MSCERPFATQVLLRIDADEATRARAATLDVTIYPQDSPQIVRSEKLQGPDARLTWGNIVVPLQPVDDDATRRFRVKAELFDDQGELINQQVVIGRFIEDARTEVALLFEADCEVVVCGERATCEEGRCIPACVTPVVSETRIETPSTVCASFAKSVEVIYEPQTALQDFALLVHLANDPDLAANAGDQGETIGFLDAQGKTLDHEIESYDSDTGELIAWVLVPLLQASEATSLRMVFGGEASPENTTRVWSGYRGVWHFSERDGDVIADSTMHKLPGRVMQGELNANAVIGSGFDSPGSTESVNWTDPIDGHLDFGPADNLTVSAWYRLADLETEQFMIFKGPTSVNTYGYRIQLALDGSRDDAPYLRFIVGGDDTRADLNIFNELDTEWTHLAMTLDRNTDEFRIYRDGIRVDTLSDIAMVDPNKVDNTQELAIGLDTRGGYSGQVDELRVGEQPLSDERAIAQFTNQSNPQSFVTVGSLEDF